MPVCVAPGAPQNFQFFVQGPIVTLAQRGPASGGAPSMYLVEAGTGRGSANLVVAPVGATLVQMGAPPGTYCVRVRAQNACGVSAPSNEQVIRVQ